MNNMQVINRYPNENCSLLYWYEDCGGRGWRFALACLGKLNEFGFEEDFILQQVRGEGVKGFIQTQYLKKYTQEMYEQAQLEYATH